MNTTTQNIGTTTLKIDGMTCGHCVQAVTEALSAVPGMKVKSVAVGSAVIEANDKSASGKAAAALEEAGYPSRAVGGAVSSSAQGSVMDVGGCCGGEKAAMAGGKPGGGTSGCCCG